MPFGAKPYNCKPYPHNPAPLPGHPGHQLPNLPNNRGHQQQTNMPQGTENLMGLYDQARDHALMKSQHPLPHQHPVHPPHQDPATNKGAQHTRSHKRASDYLPQTTSRCTVAQHQRATQVLLHRSRLKTRKKWTRLAGQAKHKLKFSIAQQSRCTEILNAQRPSPQRHDRSLLAREPIPAKHSQAMQSVSSGYSTMSTHVNRKKHSGFRSSGYGMSRPFSSS